MLAVLNLHTAEWDTPYDSEHFSNVLSIVVVAVIGAILLLSIIWLWRNRDKMNEKDFKERCGALVESTNTKTHKWSIVAIFLMFFLRRISFVVSVIYL